MDSFELGVITTLEKIAAQDVDTIADLQKAKSSTPRALSAKKPKGPKPSKALGMGSETMTMSGNVMARKDPLSQPAKPPRY